MQVGVGLNELLGSLHRSLGFTVALCITQAGSAMGKTLSCSKGTESVARKLGAVVRYHSAWNTMSCKNGSENLDNSLGCGGAHDGNFNKS